MRGRRPDSGPALPAVTCARTRVAVAYSGGRDSSALLHATLVAAAQQGLEVIALHVHHGLSTSADDWLNHCTQQCRRWAARGLPVRFDHRRLAGRPGRGESVEAWARRERYAALRQMAMSHDALLVLLAHHRQDQAETVLLQALRGSGVAGLAAMPPVVEREGIVWARPWLACSPGAITAYARRHRLRHIEDDSNADRRFDRNRLRLDVWPRLTAAFPHAEVSLATTAAWAREAQLCAGELAAIDLTAIVDERGLDLAAWARLSPARRSNVLRIWLRREIGETPAASLVRRLMSELVETPPAQWTLGTYALRRYRGRLSCSAAATQTPASVPARLAQLNVARTGTYDLPGWNGQLRVRRVDSGGIPMAALRSLQLVERGGGEDFQIAPGRPPRALKKQFQAGAVPEWARSGPLIYSARRLIFVPGLGIDARAIAGHGVRQAELDWLPETV